MYIKLLTFLVFGASFGNNCSPSVIAAAVPESNDSATSV